MLVTNYKPPRLTDKQSDTQVYLTLVALEHASGQLDFGQMARSPQNILIFRFTGTAPHLPVSVSTTTDSMTCVPELNCEMSGVTANVHD